MSSQSTPDAGFGVEDVAFVGRTFEEYVRMFDLDPVSLTGRRVLDCPAGAGSFVAEARERGVEAVGVDPLYDRSPGVLAHRSREDSETATGQHRRREDLLTWEFYDHPTERREYFRAAYERFLSDYSAGRRAGRYIAAALPDLPFAEDSFSLVLSAHLLFLYGDRFDYDFHRRSLRELVRVAEEEVRVFPLAGLDDRQYGRIEELRWDLQADGHESRVVEVPYEFRPDGNRALVIEPRP